MVIQKQAKCLRRGPDRRRHPIDGRVRVVGLNGHFISVAGYLVAGPSGEACTEPDAAHGIVPVVVLEDVVARNARLEEAVSPDALAPMAGYSVVMDIHVT